MVKDTGPRGASGLTAIRKSINAVVHFSTINKNTK